MFRPTYRAKQLSLSLPLSPHQPHPDGHTPENVAHKYPSSSHYTRDWDKLVVEIKKEEKDEKLEGDAALNQLFQNIYKDGNEEVRKAMNKSFVSFKAEVENPQLEN